MTNARSATTPAISTPVGPPPQEQKSPLNRIRFSFCFLKSRQNPLSQVGGAVDYLKTGRGRLRLWRTEIGMPAPVATMRSSMLLIAQEAPDRRGDVGRREACGRDLVN